LRPPFTDLSTLSASSSILAAVSFEIARFVRRDEAAPGSLRVVRFREEVLGLELLHRLRLFLHLRRRDPVGHLEELPPDRARLASFDPADGIRDLFDVELEDAAPLGLVVGGLALADVGGQLPAALLRRELGLLQDLGVVGHRLLGLAGERHPHRSDVHEEGHRTRGEGSAGLAQQVVAPVGAHDGVGDAAGTALEEQRDAVREAEQLDRLV
jgi:hypothetical protein